MALPLATAFVRIRPDTAGFKQDVDAGLRGVGTSPTVTREGALLGANLGKAAQRTFAEFKLPVNFDDRAAKLGTTDLATRVKGIAELAKNLRADMDDKPALAKVATIQASLKKLSDTVIKPKVSDSELLRAEATALRFEHTLERINGKRVTADVTADTRRSFLSRLGGLFGGGGGGAGGAAGAAGAAGKSGGGVAALLTGATPPSLQAAGIGAAVAGGAVLAPAAIPAALGLGVGGLGALLTAPKAIGKDLTGALDAVKKALQPLRGLFTGVFAPLPGFVHTLAPMLRDLFKASVPYLQTFVKFMEQATKTLLPVFTKLLKEFQPDLPLIAKGLNEIVKGLAGFLNALGPKGMQAASKIFVAAAIAMAYALRGLGIAVNWLAEHIPVFVHDIAKWWDWLRHRIAARVDDYRKLFDDFRHRTAVIFDGMRHEIAHVWTQIFENTIGVLIRLGHNVATQYNAMQHSLLAILDRLRHDAAHLWDMIWNNTVGRIRNGIHDADNLFDNLRHGIASRLDNLRHDIAHVWDVIWNNTVGRAERGVRDIGNAVDKIRHVFADPINWVIKNVLNRLIGGFDWITSHIGLGKPIPTIKLAKGGRIPGYGGGDQLPALLEGGETIVSKEHSRVLAPMFKAAGVPGYQRGGVIGNKAPGRFPGQDVPGPGSAPFGGGALSDIAGFFKGAYSTGRMLAAATSGNSKALTNALSALIGHNAGGAGGDLKNLLLAMPAKGVTDVVHWLISHAKSLFGGGPEIVKYAASWLGKVPAAGRGGTALPGGADCSGFTQTVYKRFGYNAPRTSEAQGSWVKRGNPTPGGLVFFNSPAGGPPPGHVGIVMDGSRMISQAGPEGALGPTVGSLAGRMFAGVPPSGFSRAGRKGAWSLGGLEGLWQSAGGPGGNLAHVAGAIALAESGGNPRARNPSGASGLWQILGLPFPGNPFDPQTNARMAVFKYHGAQGFSPWVTYETGAYRQFMDRGGTLAPGWNQVYNGTGKPEPLVPAATRDGPLVHIENQVINDRADVEFANQRTAFTIQSAGFGR